MMTSHGDQDDEELNLTNTSKVGMLLEPKGNNIPEIPFCGCLSVQFYQPYFDIDTTEVISRIMSSMFYCKREENFLTSLRERPDAYGPFWIVTTLVFTVAVTSHLNSWLASWLLGKHW